jgi:hypothetical protein
VRARKSGQLPAIARMRAVFRSWCPSRPVPTGPFATLLCAAYCRGGCGVFGLSEVSRLSLSQAALKTDGNVRSASTRGRHCKVCSHPERARIEAAVRRGAPLRAIERADGISARAIARHRDNCAQLPVVPRAAPSRTPLLNTSGNITVDAVGHIIADDTPRAPAPSRDFLHEQRWWTPSSPGPRWGDRCAVCGSKEDWWYVRGWWGGCGKCWKPAIVDGRMCTFKT